MLWSEDARSQLIEDRRRSLEASAVRKHLLHSAAPSRRERPVHAWLLARKARLATGAGLLQLRRRRSEDGELGEEVAEAW